MDAAISSGINMLTEAKLKAGEMLSPWLSTLIEEKHPGAAFVITTIRAKGSAYTEFEKGLGTSEELPRFHSLRC